jgi:hypothetical protein
MVERRHWVIVVSREHARRGVAGGFVMANHGKRAPLARMSPGDGILMYSPTTAYPHGEPLRAVIREHLPVSRLRFGFFELPPADALAVWALVVDRSG